MVHSSVVFMTVCVDLHIKAFFMLIWAQKSTCSLCQPPPPHTDRPTH